MPRITDAIIIDFGNEGTRTIRPGGKSVAYTLADIALLEEAITVIQKAINNSTLK